MKMAAKLTNHKVSHLIKPIAMWKYYFCHDMKARFRLHGTSKIQVVLSKKKKNGKIYQPFDQNYQE